MTQMRAWQLMAVDDLQLNSIDMPKLDEGTVLVQVKACGVCSSDLPRIFRNGTYHFPTVPGHEFAGLVVDGKGAEASDWVGKRVAVFPLIPCGECAACQDRSYEMCANYDYLGSRSDGGFAEFVRVPVWNLIELPENVTYEQASLLEPAAVAYHAVAAVRKRMGVVQNAVVSGSGAIGLLIAKWQKLFGASSVTVVGRNETKRSLIEGAGIAYVDSCDPSQLGSLLCCEAVYEAVGSQGSLSMCIDMADASGCVALVGNPEGDMSLERDVYWKILRRQLCLVGVWNSSYESQAPSDWSAALAAMADGSLDVSGVVTHRFPFGELDGALSMMRGHERPYLKVMIVAE